MALVEDLYKKLSEGGYYTKTLGEFEAQLEDPMYRKKVHNVVTRDGIEDTDFETFDVKYTPLKKKEESDLPSMESETSGSLATPEMGTQEPLVSSSLQRKTTTTTTYKAGVTYIQGGTGIFTKGQYVQTDTKGHITGKSYVDAIINQSSIKNLLGIKSDPNLKYLVEKTPKMLEEVKVTVPKESFVLKRKKRKKDILDILSDFAQRGSKATMNFFQDIIVPDVEEREQKRLEEEKRIAEKAQKIFDKEFRVLDLNDPEDFKQYKKQKAILDFKDASIKAAGLAIDVGSDALVDVLNSTFSDDFGFEYESGLMGTVTITLPNGTERVFDANGADAEKKLIQAFVDSVLENQEYYKTLNKLSKTSYTKNQIEYNDLQKKLAEEEYGLKQWVAPRSSEYAAAVFGKSLNTENLQQRRDYNAQQIMSKSITLEDDISKFKEQEAALLEAYSNGVIDYTTYNSMLNSGELAAARENIVKQSEELELFQKESEEDDQLMQDLHTTATIIEQERGNSVAYIGANFLKGFTDIFGGLYYLDQAAKGKGRYVDDVSISDIAEQFGGLVTEEYVQNPNMPMWQQAIGGIAGYAPGMLFDLLTTGGAATVAKATVGTVAKSAFTNAIMNITKKALLSPSDIGMGLISFKQFEDQLNSDPVTKNIPEEDKILMGLLLSYTTAKLEKVGMSSWLPKNLKSGYASSILRSAFTSVPKNASKEVIEAAIDRNIASALSKGLINTSKAGGTEYVTEGLQTGAEETIGQVYDALKGTDYFEDKTIWDVASNMDHAGRIGLVGGAIMGGITNSFNTARSVRNNLQTKQIINVLEDPDLKEVYKTYLTNQYKSGSMSKEEVAFLTAQLKIAEDHFSSIPDNIEDKTAAFDLITERDEINRSIAGKDEALIAGQKERIEQINNELKTISKNATKKSTEQQQEGTAEGGVVQREGVDEGQPQVGQGEGTVGETTQPEANISDSTVTGGGVQETEVVTEQPVAEEIVTEQPIAEETITEQPTVEEVNIVPGETAVVSDVQITYPTNEEAEVRREERTRPEYVEATSENLQEENVEQLSQELEGEFGLLTAENPMAQPLTEEENAQLNQKAEEWLKSRGYNPRRVTGKYDQAENSFFVPNLTFNDAVEFANEFNQEAVAHSEGLVYQDGTINPRVKQDDDFSFQSYSPESNFVSVVKTPSGLKTFSVGYNTKIRTNFTAPSQSSMGTVISGTDVEIETRAAQISKPRMTKIVANAAKAVSRILPNNKFIVHDTQDSFTAATGETDAGGYFDPASGEIHINLEQANARTVAHEVFHAVLLNAVKTDANAAVTTRKMIEAVSNKIESNPQLKQYLDEFASNYEENIQNEEKVSELVGVLAEQYESSPESVKDVIKRWLDRIAKAFGLNPFNRNEVYDVLNTVARKTAKGKTIKQKDIVLITKETPGSDSFIGSFNIPRKSKGKKAPSVKNDPRDFIRNFVQDLDIRELNGQNFVTNMYDYTNAGITDLGNGFSINTLGGKNYVPLMMSLKNLNIGDVSNLAAFNTKAQAETFIRNAEMGNANLFAPHAGTLDQSWQFQQHTFAELFNLVLDNGILKPKELISTFNNVIKNNKENQAQFKQFAERYGKNIKNFNSFISDPKKIIDLLDINNNYSPKLRKALNSAIASNKKFKQAIGANNLNEFYKRIMDPLNDGVIGGEIMNVVDFDPNTFEIVQTNPNDIDHHPSFGWTLLAKINGIYQPTEFHKSSDITDTYTKYNISGAETSVKIEEPKFEQKNVSSSAGAIPKVAKFNVSPRRQKSLPKEVADKLTEDGEGNYIFHHYSGKRRETIQPRSGDNIITSREEAAALSSVGGVAQFYTQEGQKESGVGPVLHTIVVPKDKVYYLQNDVENFYDEAKRQFLEVRPGQAFNANYQAAWIGKVAADNGYDMLVSNWRGDELRAQTVKELTPIEENIPFKEKEANVYKVGDEVIVYGSKATITAMDGTVATFKGEGVAGSIDTDRNANLITKVRRQKSLKNVKALDIMDKNKKYIEDRTKRTGIKDIWRGYRQKFEDRQADIKRSISGVDNVYSKRASSLLVNKAGASGWAEERFKEADKKIYKGLNSKEMDLLNAIIYAKRIIAINENRAKRGMKAYKGMDGYSTSQAEADLQEIRNAIGDVKYADFLIRSKEYFKVYEENLKQAYESGRITEEVYNMLKDIEYSPIRTLKYLIGEDQLSADQIDKQASILGITNDDIKRLGDQNENAFVADTRWLMMMSINAAARKNFENKLLNAVFDAFENANDSETYDLIEEFYEYNPVIGTRKDGSLIYKYDKEKIPVGYREVVFYKDGVKRKMVMKNRYADQLLDVNNVPSTLKTIGKLTGGDLLRFFATSGNPLFILGNVAADFSNILFLSDVYGKIKPVGAVHLAFDFVKNFLRSTTGIKFKEIKREYLEHGGSISYMSADGVRNLQSRVSKYKILSYPQKALVAYGKTMSYLGEKSEEAFRISVYEKTKNDLIKKYKKENNGLDPKGQDLEDIMNAAVTEARQVIDFNQGGEWAKNVDAVMPYFNAGMQGLRRTREFAAKKPGAFASSMVQAATMAGGIAAYSIAALIQAACAEAEDEDDCNKKMMDALNSIPEYEKANYHIIFTGKKDKNGEYEYVRIKKLPGLSVVTTYAEQLFTKFFFSSRGVDYDIDNDIFWNTVKSSVPFYPENVLGKNPLVAAGIAYGLNYDTFKGDQIFKKPRGWEDREISPEMEGINDDNVNSLFKYIAPALGMSPIRTQAMIEKIITSESTNPTISLLYGVANGLFGEGTTLGESFSMASDEFLKNVSKKLVRTTNKNILKYDELDAERQQEISINDEEYNAVGKMYKDIGDVYDSGKKLTGRDLQDMIIERFDPVTKDEFVGYFNRFNNHINNRGTDTRLLNIVFERRPKLQAFYLYKRYGSSLESEELNELNKIMQQTKSRISDETLIYYNKEYKNK